MWQWVNSLWSITPHDDRYGSTWAQVMACCLRHQVIQNCLNQCWFIISKVLWTTYKICIQMAINTPTNSYFMKLPPGNFRVATMIFCQLPSRELHRKWIYAPITKALSSWRLLAVRPNSRTPYTFQIGGYFEVLDRWRLLENNKYCFSEGTQQQFNSIFRRYVYFSIC